MKKKDIESSDDDNMIVKDDDSPLGITIKRPNTKYIEHKSKLLIPGSNRILIAGSSGTGKSTLVLQLIPQFSNKTTTIILASVKPYDDVHTAVEKYCKQQKIKFIKTTNEDETSSALNDLLEQKDKNEHAIFIADDFAVQSSDTSKKEGSAHSIMNTCAKVFRSFQISIIFITQQYHGFSTAVRDNVNMKIIFQLSNRYSIDAFIQDEIGRFYDGSNETEVRKDLRQIYRRVYEKPHAWILSLSNPNQIRLGWKEIVYPTDQVGIIEGGSVVIEKKKKKISTGINKKRELYREAVKLGFPQYMYRVATPQQLTAFIKGKGKDNVDDYDTEPVESLRHKLSYAIRKYKDVGNPRTLERITDLCNKIITNDESKIPMLKYVLKRAGLDDLIEF